MIITACTPVPEGGITPTPSHTPTSVVCRVPPGGIIPAPTVESFPNPDLATSTPVTGTPIPTDTPTATLLPWCSPTPSPTPENTPLPPPPTSTPVLGSGGRSGGEENMAVSDGAGVDSLTIDIADQSILAIASGPMGNTIFWKEGNSIMASSAQSGGGSSTLRFVQTIGRGDAITAAYSPAGRLHVVYSDDGKLFYRAANHGMTISEAADEPLIAGGEPSIAVDSEGWAHILCSADGYTYHLYRDDKGWHGERVEKGASPHLVVTETGALVASSRSGSKIRIFRRDDRQWREHAYIEADGLLGTPHLDTDGEWIYLAWVTEHPDPDPSEWPRRRPEYKPAMPFINRVSSGDNSQQYFTVFGIHDAGIYQTIATSPGSVLNVSAEYMGWSCDDPSPCPSAGPTDPNPPSGSGANMRVQICIDPTGGVDIYSPAVVCSGVNNSLDAWSSIGFSAIAQANNATIFLRSQPDLPRAINNVYWDNVQISGGALLNPGLDGDSGTFFPWNGIQELKVAEGWQPFYIEDPPSTVGTGRYVVHTAWSNDDGLSWSNSANVAINATSTHDKTGAFGTEVYPFINIDHQYAAFFFMFEEGDPMPGQEDMKRFGRPSLTVCELGETKCDPWRSGARLFPNDVNRPAVSLIASADSMGHVIIGWDAYQSSRAKSKDVYTAILSP
ncbi:MAG: hypothetical protein GY803_10230 [Chloroflexi bacterium]|nr:hypothetical protein [Chloroflexota bacterium]